MINKIKDWFFFKYGVEVKTMHIWLILILIFSIVLLLGSLMNNGRPGTKIDPKKMPPLPGMPGGVSDSGMSGSQAPTGKIMSIPSASSAVSSVPMGR